MIDILMNLECNTGFRYIDGLVEFCSMKWNIKAEILQLI